MEVVANLWKSEETNDDSPASNEYSYSAAKSNDGRGKSNHSNNGSLLGLARSNVSNGSIDKHQARTADSKRNSLNGSTAVSGSSTVSTLLSPSTASTSLQKMMTDTLVEKIIKMALPPSSLAAKDQIATRMANAKNRPGLSVPIMSKNFILMNSRLGIPFTIIDNVTDFVNWSNVPMTLAVMCIYTLCVLNPLMAITCGPVCYLLFGIMVHNYIHVHLPNPVELIDKNAEKEKNNTFIEVNRNPSQGPPIRDPILPEPVPELSQEFVINLTDLQNHLLLYVNLFDGIYYILKKFAFFINEPISTSWFMGLLSFVVLNYLFIDIIWYLIPIRLILVIIGWTLIIMIHPSNRDTILQKLLSEETRLMWLQTTRDFEHKINEQLRFVEARETKTVDIFEIQVYRDQHKEWSTVGYYHDDFTKYSSLKLKNEHIETYCCKTIDEVKSPVDWEWSSSSSWELDLSPEIWVRERFIDNNVEVDSSTKWVYDVICKDNKSNKRYRRRMWMRQINRKNRTKSLGSDNVNDVDNRSGISKGKDGISSEMMDKGLDNNDSTLDINESSMMSVGDSSRAEDIEEVINPMREEHNHGHVTLRGIARRSLSGASGGPSHEDNNNNNNNYINSRSNDITEEEDEDNDKNSVLMNDVTNIINTSI